MCFLYTDFFLRKKKLLLVNEGQRMEVRVGHTNLYMHIFISLSHRCIYEKPPRPKLNILLASIPITLHFWQGKKCKVAGHDWDLNREHTA